VISSKLALRDVDGDKIFELIEDFILEYKGYALTCPKGMHTDGASIPRFFWRIIGSPLMGKYRRACIPHDAGYKGVLVVRNADGTQLTVGRLWIDTMFHRLMLEHGVRRWRAQLMYRAVRYFSHTYKGSKGTSEG